MNANNKNSSETEEKSSYNFDTMQIAVRLTLFSFLLEGRGGGGREATCDIHTNTQNFCLAKYQRNERHFTVDEKKINFQQQLNMHTTYYTSTDMSAKLFASRRTDFFSLSHCIQFTQTTDI